jgi:putative peptidoglycan lipid II flippase
MTSAAGRNQKGSGRMSSMAEIPSPEETIEQPTDRLGRSASMAGLATLTSRILGLIRDAVLAAVFGAGNEMDAFVVAFRIPNLVRELFAEGAMSAAFVPTFTKCLTLKGKPAAWLLGNHVLNALLVVTGLLVTIGFVAARPLVTIYAGDYSSIPGKLDLTIELARIMLPFLTLAAIAAAVMGMLNSLRHYFVPALAPAAFNVATIACALLLAPLMPAIGQPRIMAIAVAALLGGLGQIALQWPALRTEGFRYAPRLDPGDHGLREVVLLMGPGTLGLAATQINLLISTQLAVGQGTGAVSWLQYAFRLMNLPIGLFGVSIATAVLPAVARHAAIDDRQAVSRTIARGITLMLMVTVPASVGLFMLATPIVQVLLERGHFVRADTAATASAVQCYAVGLVGYSAARIVSPVFYALRRARLAVILSTITIIINLVFSVILVRWMGFRGLALATSLAAIAHGGLSLGLLRRQIGRIGGNRLAITFLKIAAASGVMALVVTLAMREVSLWMPGPSTTLQLFRLTTAIGSGLLALALSAKYLRISEFDEVIARLLERLPSGSNR